MVDWIDIDVGMGMGVVLTWLRQVSPPPCFTKSLTTGTNRLRTMTFGFGFCSVLCGVGVGSFLLLSGSVFDKTWILIRFVLAGFGFLPISK